MSLFQKSAITLFLVFLISFTWHGVSLGDELSVQIRTTPDQAVFPFEVGFEAIVSDGMPPYSHTWNFGDGGSSTLTKGNHYYRESGQYTVSVMVSDAAGNYGVAFETITVSPNIFNPEDAVFKIYSNTNSVTQIIQDKNNSNILWIGTTGGLVRLNMLTGEKKIYLNELPNIRIQALIQSSDRAIWVGTRYGLTRFDYDKNQWAVYDTSNSDLPHNWVNFLLQSSDGVIWLGTNYGLVRFDYAQNQWAVYDTSNSDLPDNNIKTLFQSSGGAIWAGTKNGGLARFDYNKNQWAVYDASNSDLLHNRVNSLLQSSDGTIWVGTNEDGLAGFDYGKNQWTVYDTFNSNLPDNQVTALLQSSDGAIWVGTDGGLARFDYNKKQWTVYDISNSDLSDNNILSLLQSSDEAIMIGIRHGGLARFDYDEKQWTVYDISNNDLPVNNVLSLLQSTDRAIWVGTTNNLARFDYDKNQWTVYDMSNSDLPDKRVNCLLQSTDGAVWMGTNDGLARFDYDKNLWTIYDTSCSDLPDNEVESLLQSSDKAIWVGTDGGLARFDYDKDQWTIYDTSNSDLPHNRVESLLQSPEGAVWIATADGLARFEYDKGQWTVYDTSNSDLPHNPINYILQSSDGAIWAGTYYGDLVRFDYDKDQWTVYNISNSDLSGDFVYSLLQSSDGAIWMGTGDGLVRFDYGRNQWIVYNASDSDLPYATASSLLQSPDEGIWVGTLNGLCKITFPATTHSAGRLILIGGGGASETNTLWTTTKELTTTAYRIFNLRGFKNSDIYLISPEKWIDFNGDGFDDHIVDCPPQNEDRNPTAEDVHYAITDWAVKNHAFGTPLYIYLVDHGYADDGEHGPGFMVAPGEFLYASDLNDMLNIYEQATDGQVILINESCYSGQFLDPLKKQDRIIITSTADKIVNYDNQGTNSFTHFFLQKLFENNSIQQAFAKAVQRLRKSSLTYTQMPQLDDNGDGKSDMADGILASAIKLGGDHVVGAPWPEILSTGRSEVIGTSVSFTATTNAHMKRVWATVHPPGYIPDTTGDYQEIDLEKFDFRDDNDDMIYEGVCNSFTHPGNYVITIYAKDQFGNTAVSDSVEIIAGTDGKGSVTGQIELVKGGYTISVNGADITMSLLETGSKAAVDSRGYFSINGVPEGRYTLKAQGTDIEPVTISDVTVLAGQATSIPRVEIPFSCQETGSLGDPNGDGKINMEDVIYYLQVLSGIR